MISRSTHLSAEERREVATETTLDLAAEQNPTDIKTGAFAACMSMVQSVIMRSHLVDDATRIRGSEAEVALFCRRNIAVAK